MAERILGLMGPGNGPLVCTRDLGSEPHVRITGLTEGGVVEIEAEGRTVRFTENGCHKLVPADFMRARSEGSPHMICTLLAGSKRAVS
jgi:hypothetical protein